MPEIFTLEQLLRMTCFLDDKVQLDIETSKFTPDLLFNNNSNNNSNNKRRFNNKSSEELEKWIEQGYLKISRYYICSSPELLNKKEILMESRIFKQISSYSPEGDIDNLCISYVYEKTNPSLTVEVNKEWDWLSIILI